MSNVVKMQPKWVREIAPIIERINAMPEGYWEARAKEQCDELRKYPVHTLRYFWDNVSDVNSFYEGREGKFDCQFIHQVLNEKGDGHYCAV